MKKGRPAAAPGGKPGNIFHGEQRDEARLKPKPDARIYGMECGHRLCDGQDGREHDERRHEHVYCERAGRRRGLLEERVQIALPLRYVVPSERICIAVERRRLGENVFDIVGRRCSAFVLPQEIRGCSGREVCQRNRVLVGHSPEPAGGDGRDRTSSCLRIFLTGV